jgi:hypothetical protein
MKFTKWAIPMFGFLGWLAGLILATCSAPALAQGRYTPVTEAQVADLKLNHYFTADGKGHQPDFEWTFTKDEFVVKKGTGQVPADLIGKLLPDGKSSDEIRGKWKLGTKSGELVLSDIKSGEKPGHASVTLPIVKTAPTVVRIGEPQYVFALTR